ncbi:hypothetical protein K450DRAFT_218397 [Umbelopsis ramanniana AG]|uniref:Rieske domain-containing protein n=1 Tax=Umbelopsis ramanniana AG TaxID=1314678 RepID=A0AAD5HJA8_UMBRA|nr:uncharacterized protein K450DRAFT_218397 [Umbelopsis ramanniana AG]KAI8584148.1 hypothetical protein K450DRAFT_218397 [Umbelopsis ramanniana AG]
MAGLVPTSIYKASPPAGMLLSLTRRYITRTSPTLHFTIRTMAIAKHVVAKESDLKDGEKKEVKIGETPVLLSKVKGSYYATSARCTHYGAPLVNGTLASDGRIMCPWHGACFNATTGDIEDAPALNSLQKFEVTVQDGDVIVEADESALAAGKRKPACVKHNKKGYTGKIRVVSREDYLPIDRPKVSKTFGTGDPAGIALRDASHWKSLDVEFKLGTDVTSVDPKGKSVTLSNGDKWTWNHLVLATGGWPKKIPIPGVDLSNVFTLRTVHNNNTIQQAVKSFGGKPNVVVIGSSFIGMELASVASKEANVTVVGMEKVPFERVLGEKVGGALGELHKSNGVNLIMNANVEAIEPREDKSSVGSVKLKGGQTLPADVVVLGVGVGPQTDYLKNSPDFTLEKDGSLKVDQHFKVEGFDHIYATGDIATFPYQHTGQPLRIEHWGFAENTGRTVALNIASKPKKFTHVPYFWTAQHGKSIRYAGFAKEYDDVIIHGDLKELAFAAYYAKGEEILAIASLNKDPVVSYSAELLRIGKMPKASELRKGVNPLDIPLVV